jgi:hypothetical protein
MNGTGKTLRTGLAVLALAATLAACDRGAGGGGGAAATPQEKAKADSAVNEQKALRDSGVTVDTQTIDTGSAATPAPTDDN